MHVQSRNPSHERDHRISLMPLDPSAATEHHIGAILAVLAVIGVGLYLWGAW